MSEKKETEIIKEILKEMLKKMGFTSEIKIENSTKNRSDGTVYNIITTAESSFLIGQYGLNLQAIQHLARLIIRKKIDEKTNFIIDVNDYRQQKNESVLILAQEGVQKALEEKRVVVLKPMSGYERRLVHMELAKDERVITESIGDGEDRKIIIKPIDSI